MGQIVGQIVGWRLTEDDKIILSVVVSESGLDIDVELPLEMYKEIVVDGPPSEERVIREIVDKIHEVIQKRTLHYDKLIEEIIKNNARMEKALTALEKAETKLDVSKWKAYLDGVGKLKGSNQEYRHLIKALYQDESKLRASLLRKLKG